MSDNHDDIPLLRAALGVARDDIILEADLDADTAAALRRWRTPYGRSGSFYWLESDVIDLLAGCD